MAKQEDKKDNRDPNIKELNVDDIDRSKYHNLDRRLYEPRNTDDVFLRNIIGGLLNMLNNKLKYKQVWSEDTVEEVTIPFFYTLGHNDERMVQDNFMFFQNVCEWESKIDGNYDSFPRGILTLNNTSIEASSITNRFVLGEYSKKVGDEFVDYVSYLYALPMKLEFGCEIICDTHLTMLKAEQAVRETFYKNRTFFVMFKGLKLRARVGFGDSSSMTSPIEHKMGSAYNDGEPKLSFTFSVDTYHPIFDPYTEMRADNYITNLLYEVKLEKDPSKYVVGEFDDEATNEKYKVLNIYGLNKPTGNIVFTNDYSDKVISSNDVMYLEWDYRKLNAEMKSVIIAYLNNDTGEVTTIHSGSNSSYYDWDISKDLNLRSDLQKNFIITLHPQREDFVYETPTFTIIPNPETKSISKESFGVVNKGYFMEPRSGEMEISIFDKKEEKEYKGVLNIRDGVVFKNRPLKMFEDFKYKGEITPKHITIIIQDAEEGVIHAAMTNITIV